ncbi:hypothetical protein [Sphingomonas sp. ID0503]|uniref:hypothetical protein n=1 Tax=Sphingomonas sp. ID0503 TaxID=3399691 RepID=UPI003AFA4EC8
MRDNLIEALLGRIILVTFGVGILAFLVAADRTDWFNIRPATGATVALAQASADRPSAGPQR